MALVISNPKSTEAILSQWILFGICDTIGSYLEESCVRSLTIWSCALEICKNFSDGSNNQQPIERYRIDAMVSAYASLGARRSLAKSQGTTKDLCQKPNLQDQLLFLQTKRGFLFPLETTRGRLLRSRYQSRRVMRVFVSKRMNFRQVVLNTRT